MGGVGFLVKWRKKSQQIGLQNVVPFAKDTLKGST